MNLLTVIAPLAVAATFMMPADAANHKELPALGNTHIQVFDKTPVCFRPDSFPIHLSIAPSFITSLSSLSFFIY